MNNKALAIAHIREMREELHILYELLASLAAALDAECEDRSWPSRKILLAKLVVGAVRKPWIIHPGNRIMALQIPTDAARVGDMALHADVKGLEPLQQQESVEGALARTVVPQHLA